MFFHVRYLISNQQLTEYYVIFLILHRKNPSFDTLEFVRTLIVSTDDPISDSSLIALMTATSNCPLKLLFTLNSEHFQFFLPLFLHYHHSPRWNPPWLGVEDYSIKRFCAVCQQGELVGATQLHSTTANRSSLCQCLGPDSK